MAKRDLVGFDPVLEVTDDVVDLDLVGFDAVFEVADLSLELQEVLGFGLSGPPGNLELDCGLLVWLR